DVWRGGRRGVVEWGPMPGEEESGEGIYNKRNDLKPQGGVGFLEDMTRHALERLHLLVSRHARLTGSARAAQILADWTNSCRKFRKVMPLEYRRALAELEKARTMQAAE